MGSSLSRSCSWSLVSGPLADARPSRHRRPPRVPRARRSTVSRTTGLDPAGEVVTVTGSGLRRVQGHLCLVLRPAATRPEADPVRGWHRPDWIGRQHRLGHLRPARLRRRAHHGLRPGRHVRGGHHRRGGPGRRLRLPGHRLRRGHHAPTTPGPTTARGRVRARVIRPGRVRRASPSLGRKRRAGHARLPARRPSHGTADPSTATVERRHRPLDATARPGAPGDGRPMRTVDRSRSPMSSRILPVNLYGSIAEIVFSLGLGRPGHRSRHLDDVPDAAGPAARDRQRPRPVRRGDPRARPVDRAR